MLQLITIVALIAVCLTGCDRKVTPSAPASPPAAVPELPADREINEWLLKVFLGHQVPASIQGNWVVFPNTATRINAAVSASNPNVKDAVILQIDFRILLPDGRQILHPCAGWADSRAAAIASAEASFLTASFHPILVAFFDADDPHQRPETRTIAGRERRVIEGDILTKVMRDQEVPRNSDWTRQLGTALDRLQLTGGVHVIDVYNCFTGESQMLEILVDGRRCTALEQDMLAAAWPKAKPFVSVRQLTIIQDPNDATLPRPVARASSRPTTHPQDH